MCPARERINFPDCIRSVAASFASLLTPATSSRGLLIGVLRDRIACNGGSAWAEVAMGRTSVAYAAAYELLHLVRSAIRMDTRREERDQTFDGSPQPHGRPGGIRNRSAISDISPSTRVCSSCGPIAFLRAMKRHKRLFFPERTATTTKLKCRH